MTTRMENAANRAAKAARRAMNMVEKAKEEDNEEKALADPGPEQDVKELLAGLPAEAEIKLYRFIAGTSKLEFCEAFAEPGEFSENGVRAKWGGGTYRLVVRVPDKAGRMVFPPGGAARVFRLAAPPLGLTPPPAPVEKPRSWEDTMAMQLFQALMAQQQQQAQSMRESQESHRAMIAMMLRDTAKPNESVEFFKMMLPLLIPAKTDPVETALRVAAALKPAGPTAGIVEQMAMLEKFLSIIRKGEGGGGGGDRPIWFEALKEVAPLIQQAFTIPRPAAPVAPGPTIPEIQAAHAPRPVSPVSEAPSPVPNPNPPTEEPVIQLHPMLAQLDRMMPVLIESAALKLNVELQADWTLERIPEAHFEDFVSWVERPEALDMLLMRYPDAAVYRDWFRELLDSILAAVEDEPDEPEPNAAHPPADPEPVSELPDETRHRTTRPGGQSDDLAAAREAKRARK